MFVYIGLRAPLIFVALRNEFISLLSPNNYLVTIFVFPTSLIINSGPQLFLTL